MGGKMPDAVAVMSLETSVDGPEDSRRADPPDDFETKAAPSRLPVLQHQIIQRLLLTALRETEAADEATVPAGDRLAFLAAMCSRFSESLDETRTRDALAGLILPGAADWCIVDIIEGDGTISRHAMVHPNPRKQELLLGLERNWPPQPGDPFGAPAVMHNARPVMITGQVDDALAASAHSEAALERLRKLGVGSLLTVPLLNQGHTLGALTFVSNNANRVYTREEIELARSIAVCSADALENARRYGDALLHLELAEAASQSRLQFLANISHELRTPLNAISGWVEILEEGLHGPVTQAQRGDLDRIRRSQKHLLALINDLTDFVRTGATRVRKRVDVPVHEAVAKAYALVEDMARKKSIRYQNGPEPRGFIAHADPEGVHQILVNLMANAIKFTPRGGELAISYAATPTAVQITVADSGIGIPEDRLESIFEPFVQVAETRGQEGSGLGLTISRDLAYAMRGNLTVTSAVGKGSRFTLTLPRAFAKAGLAKARR
jgi:signal transduction histidine kinase